MKLPGACIECNNLTRRIERCARCGGSLCIEHVPFGGHRCNHCELEWHERRTSLRTGWWAALGFLLIWPVFFAVLPQVPAAMAGGHRTITTGIPKLDFLIMMSLAGYYLARSAAGLRVAIERWRFLRETTGKLRGGPRSAAG